MTAGYAKGTSHVMTADESCKALPLATGFRAHRQ